MRGLKSLGNLVNIVNLFLNGLLIKYIFLYMTECRPNCDTLFRWLMLMMVQ